MYLPSKVSEVCHQLKIALMFVCLFVGLPTRFSVPCGTETESPRSSSASRNRSGPKEGEVTLMSLES